MGCEDEGACFSFHLIARIGRYPAFIKRRRRNSADEPAPMVFRARAVMQLRFEG